MSTRPLTFRQTETEQLMRLAQAGESAAIIGVSGVGKSNLFNHLLDPQVQNHYLGDGAVIFVRVNFHFAADFTTRSVFSLILEQIELLGERLGRDWLPAERQAEIERYHDALLAAGDDLLVAQRYFKKGIRAVMTADSSRHLVFLFDQFGEVYREADERLFANLRGLREDYKYRLSYFVFTRQAFDQLPPADRAREEFCELLTANQIGLRPYGADDAADMIAEIARRQNKEVSAADCQTLFELSGGHSGLLRAATAALLGGPADGRGSRQKKIDSLAAVPAIQQEGQKIWNSVALAEQRLLSFVAHGEEVESAGDHEGVAQLVQKGLLRRPPNGRGPFKLFSPLFSNFILHQKAVWDQPLYYDGPMRRITVFGKPVDPPLTRTELQIFLLLYEHLGEPVSYEEIKIAVWGDKEADQPLKTNIYRLRRKLEPDSAHPRFLVTVAGYGYQLNES